MEKTKVVIASILKPIDDTRMYEKIGLSLEQANKYDINIIGFASKNIPHSNYINFFTLERFPRMSFQRLLAPWKVWKYYLKVKPKVIIFNTHELLIVTFWYRILFGAKIVYDIRENYARNVRLQKIYPALVRPFLSTWIRFKELVVSPIINTHVVAEKSYLNELKFLGKKTVLLENKYKPVISPSLSGRAEGHGTVNLLYSGTISELYGIFDAIKITRFLHAIDDRIRLVIIGYCALKDDLLRLKDEIQDNPFIHLVGGDHLVPHEEIVEEIQKADFGFILNLPNPASDNKFPTRVFEYSANKLPVICRNNPLWIKYLGQFNGVIEVSPDQLNIERLHSSITNNIFYNAGDTSISLWSSEEPKLHRMMESIIQGN